MKDKESFLFTLIVITLALVLPKLPGGSQFQLLAGVGMHHAQSR